MRWILSFVIAVGLNISLSCQPSVSDYFDVNFNSKKLKKNDTLTITIKNKRNGNVKWWYYNISITFKGKYKDSVAKAPLLSNAEAKKYYESGKIKSKSTVVKLLNVKSLIEDLPPPKYISYESDGGIKLQVYIVFSQVDIDWDKNLFMESPTKTITIYPKK